MQIFFQYKNFYEIENFERFRKIIFRASTSSISYFISLHRFTNIVQRSHTIINYLLTYLLLIPR